MRYASHIHQATSLRSVIFLHMIGLIDVSCVISSYKATPKAFIHITILL